jgi:hypothetical protein
MMTFKIFGKEFIILLGAGFLLLAACSAPATLGEPAASEPTQAAAAPSGGRTATSAPSFLPESTSPAAVEPTQAPAVQPAILEPRHLTLEWPAKIKVGDSDVIRLSLEADEAGNITPTAQIAGHELHGETVFVPDLYDTHNVMAEARLDMAGLEIKPTEDIAEPLRPGSPVYFSWSVRASDVGTYRGTVWLHLRFIPLDGGPDTQKVLSAQLLEIHAVNFLGLGGTPARLLGGLGTLVGSVLGLDNLIPWVWKRVKRKSND